MKTLILGLGNPLLRDDRAGLEVARRLHKRLSNGRIDLIEAATAGLQTLPVLSGYDRAIIIDVVFNGRPPGEVYRLDGAQLQGYPCEVSHGTGLASALDWGRLVGLNLPQKLIVFAVAVTDPYSFGESLTAEVERAIPAVVDKIAQELQDL